VRPVLNRPLDLTLQDTQVAVLEECHEVEHSYHKEYFELRGGRQKLFLWTKQREGEWFPFLLVIGFDNEILLLLKYQLMFILFNQNFVDVLSRESLVDQKQEEFRMTILFAPRVIFRYDD